MDGRIASSASMVRPNRADHRPASAVGAVRVLLRARRRAGDCGNGRRDLRGEALSRRGARRHLAPQGAALTGGVHRDDRVHHRPRLASLPRRLLRRTHEPCRVVPRQRVGVHALRNARDVHCDPHDPPRRPLHHLFGWHQRVCLQPGPDLAATPRHLHGEGRGCMDLVQGGGGAAPVPLRGALSPGVIHHHLALRRPRFLVPPSEASVPVRVLEQVPRGDPRAHPLALPIGGRNVLRAARVGRTADPRVGAHRCLAPGVRGRRGDRVVAHPHHGSVPERAARGVRDEPSRQRECL
mmetsp:Transcript_70076/g.160665  ORF Transcript_70076/g.160665 Transcript_70076/m.160665 type:complete len:295 (-) Transcript_70076:2585-3469(-)